MALKMFKAPEKKPAKPSRGSVAHTVAIAAGKGGVGKSTVTVNLALALKRAGYSVGVMDTDIYGPSVRKMLPEDAMPAQQGQLIMPAVCQGIRMISMAYFRRPNEATAVRAPIANGLIHQFVNNVDWGVLDFLLIDFPPGTGDIQLTLSQQADLCGAVMVTTPQEVAAMDVRKAIHLFNQVNVPIVGIVENMSYYQDPSTKEKVYLFGKGGGERLAQQVSAPFLGGIPVDPLLSRCGDEGKSILVEDPTAPSAAAFEKLAEEFVAHVTALKRMTADCLSVFDLEWKEMS